MPELASLLHARAFVELSALVALGESLRQSAYSFVTTSPSTHAAVNARAAAAGHARARNLRDVFGFSRPFEPSVLPAGVLALARAAGVIVEDGDALRSTVRFSTLGEALFVHSAYPTNDEDAVFFGPDTYRYCDLVTREVSRSKRVVDVGCGSGAAGILVARRAGEVVLSDVSEKALPFARANATLAGVAEQCVIVKSDVLAQVEGPFDVVLANPPYMVDRASRAYRDGGGSFGEGIGVRIARQALERLEPGGRLVLYTGSAIVDGRDTFFDAVRPSLEGHAFRYREIDPDVFGDEIAENDAYAEVERIAAVSLVVVTAYR